MGLLDFILPRVPADEELEDEPPEAPKSPNPIGAALILLGALLVLIGAFVPVHSYGAVPIQKNSFVAGGEWWVVAIAVLMGVSGSYLLIGASAKGIWAVMIPSFGAIAIGIYAQTARFQRLETILNVGPGSGGSLLSVSRSYVTGTPAVGTYLVLVGGALGVLGTGLFVGFWRPLGLPAYTRRVKHCPDCAEAVLADARVCKHCGHRFAETPDRDPLAEP